jgi:pre-rRNA-processing protein TSR3
MASSGSTPTPPRSGTAGIPLFLLVAGEDHARACTGRKLLERGFAQRSDRARPHGAYPILLDPHAATPLSPADRPRALEGGLLGVDCSWNRLGERGEFPAKLPGLHHQPHRRRLPFLLAANPQHYGRLAELNTAEAFGAALCVLGESERARAILSGFAGGEAFFELNGPPLASYSACRSPEEIRSAERLAFSGAPRPRPA